MLNKNILIVLALSLFSVNAFGEVKLFRYYDRITGEERGISYSDKDGNPPVNNPDWNIIEIDEKDKEHFINLHQQQLKQKQQQAENEFKQKQNKTKAKLKAQGFTDEEIEGIIH